MNRQQINLHAPVTLRTVPEFRLAEAIFGRLVRPPGPHSVTYQAAVRLRILAAGRYGESSCELYNAVRPRRPWGAWRADGTDSAVLLTPAEPCTMLYS